MSTAHRWRSLLLALASAGCSCASPNAPAPAPEESGVESVAPPTHIEGIAPNGRPYPRLVPCPSENWSVSVHAGDLAQLGIVGISTAPDDATPLAHYRSSTADLEAKAIAELQRLRGAGLFRCHPDLCNGGEPCGLFVKKIHPNTPDGYVDGSVMPPIPDFPRRWAPSADYRRCTYASAEAGPIATGVLILAVGCSGCSERPDPGR